MFGRFTRDFDEDPFFSDFRGHRDMFESMGGFQDPFLALSDGKSKRKGQRGRSDRQVADPFGGMFQSMNEMMSNMHRHMAEMGEKADSGDPNVHSFSSSTVMSYKNDGKSQPKYYQASTSTRRAPGNIKETRRTLRDSESGIEKMAVGHHIANKGRVIERRRNNKGGAITEEKNYYHMGEEDEQEFENEWRRRTTSYNLDYGRPARGLAAPKDASMAPRPARGIAAPAERNIAPQQMETKRYDKTPAAGLRGTDIEPARPHGPSKSGRNRSKY